MKFTLSWLKERLETEADVRQIAETLTRIGLEVELVEDRGAALKDFSVARVVSAEKHPNADKLKLCMVDTGSDVVQVVCGAPNAHTGMKGVFARPGTVIPVSGETLKVSNIRGVELRGMLCSERELLLSEEHQGIIELDAKAEIGAPAAAALGLDDPVLDVAIMPNRGDCTSVMGIARDLAAARIRNAERHRRQTGERQLCVAPRNFSELPPWRRGCMSPFRRATLSAMCGTDQAPPGCRHAACGGPSSHFDARRCDQLRRE